MTWVATKSHGKVPCVNLESDSNMLGIGACYTICVSIQHEKKLTEVVPQLMVVFSERK